MSVFVHDITLEEGEDFSLSMTYKPSGVLANLTGYTARMAIRENFHRGEPLLSITHAASASGSIALGGAAGTVQVTVPGSATAVVCRALASGYGVWDLFLYGPDGAADKLIKGRVLASRSAVR